MDKSSIVGSADATSQPLLDAALGDLAERTRRLEARTVADKSTGTLFIEVVSVVGYQPAKHGQVTPVFRYSFGGQVASIKTVVVKRSEISNQADYESKRDKSKNIELSDAERTAGSADLPFIPLEPNETYDVIRLAAFDLQGGFVENPIDEPDYAGYPGNALLTFTTGAIANAPSKPTTARIVNNIVEDDSDGLLSVVTLRIYADETQALTFAAQNTVSVQPKLLDDNGDKAPSPVALIEDTSVTFIDVSVGGLITGRTYTWPKNTAFDSEGTPAVALATSTISFIAGGFADPSDSLANLTLVSVTTAATEDPALILVTFTLHQPTPAYKLKNYTAKRKVSTNPDSDYDLAKNLVVDRGDLHDPTYSTPGNIVITFPMNVKPAKTYLVKITVRAIQGFTKDFTSGNVNTAAQSLSAAQTAAQGGPSFVNGGGMRASIKDYDDTFLLAGGAAGDSKYLGKRWETFHSSGVLIDNLGSGGGGSLDADGVDWVSTQARILLDTTIVTRGGKPAVMLGKILSADEDWSGNILLIANAADVTVDITMAFVNAGGDICTAQALGFVVSHTEYKPLFFILLVPNGFTRNGKEWLEMRLAANPSNKIWTKNWQLEPLVAYHQWKMNPTEAQVQPSTNPTDTGAGLVTQIPITVFGDDGTEFTRTGSLAGEIVLT